MENITEIIGNNLASLRKAKGLTQKELAAYIHYSDKSLSKWEKGYSIPSVDVLMDFAEFYGVSVDYLLKPQSEENIKEVVKVKEAPAVTAKKGIILALVSLVVILIALCIFLSDLYINTDKPASQLLWSVFVFVVPASLLVVGVLNHFFYHNRAADTAISSVFVWTLLLAFSITFSFLVTPANYYVWWAMLIGAPVQAILILIGTYRRKN